MKKMDVLRNNRKIWIIGFLVLAGIIIILFASSIQQMEFSPGLVLTNPAEDSLPDISQVTWDEWNLYLFWRIISAVTLLGLLPMSIIYFIISKEARNRILRSVFVLTITLYALFIALQNLENLQHIPLFQNLFQSEDTAGTTAGELSNLANTEPSLVVTILATLLFTLTIFSTMYWLYLRARDANPPIEQISFTIGRAIDDINQRKDFRNVIIRCYIELQRIIEETHGRKRKASMTPREFQMHLQNLGIHNDSIENLTRLFEKARYSDGVPSNTEESDALKYLGSIQDELSDHVVK